MNSTNPRDVAYMFRDYARAIHKKSNPADPNFIRISVACAKVCLFSLFLFLFASEFSLFSRLFRCGSVALHFRPRRFFTTNVSYLPYSLFPVPCSLAFPPPFPRVFAACILLSYRVTFTSCLPSRPVIFIYFLSFRLRLFSFSFFLPTFLHEPAVSSSLPDNLFPPRIFHTLLLS